MLRRVEKEVRMKLQPNTRDRHHQLRHRCSPFFYHLTALPVTTDGGEMVHSSDGTVLLFVLCLSFVFVVPLFCGEHLRDMYAVHSAVDVNSAWTRHNEKKLKK
ncbi:unnamed protein product, partial [Ixodes persulcatus]